MKRPNPYMLGRFKLMDKTLRRAIRAYRDYRNAQPEPEGPEIPKTPKPGDILRDIRRYLSCLKIDETSSSSLLDDRVFGSYVATLRLLDNTGITVNTPSKPEVFLTAHRGDIPIVLDSGCSTSVTPFKEDFVTPIEPLHDHEMHGLTDSVTIKGIGEVEWPIRDAFGRRATIRTKAYYIPKASVRLCSPQTYMQEHKGGSILQTHEKVVLTTGEGANLEFPYQPSNNLPLMFLDFAVNQIGMTGRQLAHLQHSHEIDANMTLLENNHNLEKPQKELLLWHYRLGHVGLTLLQRLMMKVKTLKGDPSEPPLIPTKFATSARCDHPVCPACRMAKQRRRTPDTQLTKLDPNATMAIKEGDLKPGDCVSCDQYESRAPGRLLHSKSKGRGMQQYHGGSIYIDHASGLIFTRNQISLKSGETIQGKHEFEEFAHQYGVTIKHYRADNHPFNSAEFKEDLELQNQTISYSGVGAHHQNGVAERSIQTVVTWALAMMMHQLLHWPKVFNTQYWPYALEQACNIWNHLPNERGGLTPMELFTGSKCPRHDVILKARVWGCPAWVLDPKLQNGRKLPKWTKKAALGVYLGASAFHSETIGRVLNLSTGHISPQYHVMYDELFTSVRGELTAETMDPQVWRDMLRLGGLEFLGDDPDDPPDPPPPPDLTQPPDPEPPPAPPPSPPPGLPRSVPEGDVRIIEPTITQVTDARRTTTAADEGAPEPPEFIPLEEPEPEPPQPTRGRRRKTKKRNQPKRAQPSRTARGDHRSNRTRRTVLRNPAYIAWHLARDPAYAATAYHYKPKRQPDKFPSHEHYAYKANAEGYLKIPKKALLNQFMHGLDWSSTLKMFKSKQHRSQMLQMFKSYDAVNGTIEDWDPMALAAKANDADTPNWNEAMNGPDAEGFMEACRKELATLEAMQVWEVVDRQPWMNVLPSTWAFKVKRFPDGLVRKLKARFCARGDRQIEGVDFFETFAPVVKWTTVRTLLMMSAQRNLKSTQVDYTAAFVHADIDLPPNFDSMSKAEQDRQGVYVEMPKGFREEGKVYKLKKSLYGLRQSPRNFYKYLRENLESVGFESAIDVDPCLFISDKVICITYVDDCIMFAEEQADIDEAIERLRERKMTLEKESDVAGFLGVHIEHTKDRIVLTQKGLTKRIIEALGVGDLPEVSTPATDVLGKDEHGEPPNATFNYASVIGMLWYLYGHSRPDLGFAVSQAARFAFSPKRSHELALVRIGQYLKGTCDRGLQLKPDDWTSFKMDVYVDSDFLGLYGKEPRVDPDNVKSRGGFVILLNGCPMIWSSKLMDAICVSTMMAEYYALSLAMREVLPLRDVVKAVADGCGISSACQTTFRTTVWEDNMGALTLANLDPGQTTSRSRFYDSKVHWFRSHLNPADPNNGIAVKKIDTKAQLADMFTKPLPREPFTHLREMLMGW